MLLFQCSLAWHSASTRTLYLHFTRKAITRDSIYMLIWDEDGHFLKDKVKYWVLLPGPESFSDIFKAAIEPTYIDREYSKQRSLIQGILHSSLQGIRNYIHHYRMFQPTFIVAGYSKLQSLIQGILSHIQGIHSYIHWCRVFRATIVDIRYWKLLANVQSS